jgi:acyl-CoA reductase-like NAD-dependent aldehyde dehydrogenase
MVAYSIHSTVAELETLNNGKPVKVARDFDIGDSIQCLRYYAGTWQWITIWKYDTHVRLSLKTGWADKILGEVRTLERYNLIDLG